MGSDLYTINVSTYREHTTEEAIRRQSAYGFSPDASGKFFLGQGPWIEIRLDIECVHPDAPIGWDPLLVIRFIDEAVYQSSGYEWEKTPLCQKVPGLWGMGVGSDESHERIVHVVEVDFRKNPNPREGRTSDPYGDTATIAAFIHKKYAPNIKDTGFWESRAWGGGAYHTRNWPSEKHPIFAEIRSISPSLRLKPELEDKIVALAPRPEGGVWAATASALVQISPDGQATEVLNVTKTLKLSGIRHLASAPDGAVWMATPNTVVRRSPTSETFAHRKVKDVAYKRIEHVATSPEGRAYAATDNGLCIFSEDGTKSTLVREGLPDRALRHVTATKGGAVWMSSGKHLARHNADGTIDRFQSRQGIDSSTRCLALPNGGAWSLPWSGPVMYIASGSTRAVPDELCQRILPGGVSLAALGPDDALYCISKRGTLARLKAGEPPRIYAWGPDDRSLWRDVSDIAVSPEGDVWLLSGKGELFVLRKGDLANADKEAPLNTDMPHLARISPVSFGPKASTEAKAGIDFKGKTVVITGTLSKLTRDEAHKVLRERGAILSESVSKKTNYLIVGLKPSSKLQKAKGLGIPILDEDALMAPPAEASAPSNTASAAPAAKPASQAVDTRRFPLSGEPSASTSHLDSKMMRSMAQSKPPLTTKEWKALLKKHKAFIDAGGGNGKWHILEVSGLLVAALEGYKPDKGDQASLYLKQLPAGFDARKAELSWMNGCGAFAEGVNFSGAKLKNSVMSDGFFAGAKFDAADLSGVDFSRSDLRGASFKNAILTGTDFERCDLTGADFTGARVEEARFPGTKLDGVTV